MNTAGDAVEPSAGQPSAKGPRASSAGEPGRLAAVAAAAGLVGVLIGGLGSVALLREPPSMPSDRDRTVELADELAVTRDALAQATADFEALRRDTLIVLTDIHQLVAACSTEAAAGAPAAGCSTLSAQLDDLASITGP